MNFTDFFNNIKSSRYLIGFIFILAFLLRVWFVLGFSTHLMGDEVAYDLLAESILSGKGYLGVSGVPTAGRPPGYPFFLSVLYVLTGKNLLIIRLFQALIDSALCFLVYNLSKNLMGKNVALLSAVIIATHLGFIAQPAKFLTESLGTVVLFAAVIYFYNIKLNPENKVNYILSGILLAISCMIRSTFTLVIVFIVFSLLYDSLKRGEGYKKAFFCVTIYSLSFLLPIIPWTIRNYRVFNAIVPISTFQGIGLYGSYNPIRGKIFGIVPNDEITRKAKLLSTEAMQSKFLTKVTLNQLKNDPSLFFRLIGLKIGQLLSPMDWELQRGKSVYNYMYVFYFPFFLIGSFMLYGKFNEYSSLFIPVLSIFATSIILCGFPRFRLPFEPYMIIIASYSIVSIYERVKLKKRFVTFMTSFLCLNFIFYLNSSTIKIIINDVLAKLGVW